MLVYDRICERYFLHRNVVCGSGDGETGPKGSVGFKLAGFFTAGKVLLTVGLEEEHDDIASFRRLVFS